MRHFGANFEIAFHLLNIQLSHLLQAHIDRGFPLRRSFHSSPCSFVLSTSRSLYFCSARPLPSPSTPTVKVITRSVPTRYCNLTAIDSIHSVSRTIASGIVSLYNESLEKDLTPGLFGDPYYFWEAGAVFGGLIEYAHLTGDTQYNELVTTGMVHQLGDYGAFMPMNQTKSLGNDDQSFWGLAAITAAEAGLTTPESGYSSWAEVAANVFNTQIVRWDNETCGGGLKWQIFQFNAGYNYKNSISTGNLFLLSARLAQFTGNTTYLEWAEKTLKWTQDVGLVDEDYAVYDGTDNTDDCSTLNRIQWSANSATFAEGAAIMYNMVSVMPMEE
jgi:mannan endo-1,6-alpha-mannosidase